jgi:hypothetical protein
MIAGVDISQYGRAERGIEGLGREKIMALAEKHGLNVDFISTGKGQILKGQEEKKDAPASGVQPPAAHYTPDQLFAMFLHVTEAQTAILDKIKGDTGKVVATTENLWNGLQALAMRQGGDREILLNSLARLEGKGENELIAEANRKITELALSAARQGKSDEVRSPHTESKGP